VALALGEKSPAMNEKKLAIRNKRFILVTPNVKWTRKTVHISWSLCA